jgi:hypothetical protein
MGKEIPYAGAGTEQKKFSAETLLARTAPIALIVFGVVVRFGEVALSRPMAAWRDGFAREGLTLMTGTVLALVAVFIAARSRRFKLGPLPEAILKLMAVTIAPSAAVLLLQYPLSYVPFGLGFILAIVAWFVLYFVLIGVFFDLDQSDTWLCVWLIFLINLGVGIAAKMVG